MFKPIPGYDGKYKINESGIILNKKNHVMKPAQSSTGYNRVALEVYDENGKLITRNNRFVHRLVAETFIPNPDNLPVVMHLDNDKLNCHVSNLKWGTNLENYLQAINDGLTGLYNVYTITNGYEYIDCVGYKGLSYKTEYNGGIDKYVNSDKRINNGPYKGYTIMSTSRKAKIVKPLIFSN